MPDDSSSSYDSDSDSTVSSFGGYVPKPSPPVRKAPARAHSFAVSSASTASLSDSSDDNSSDSSDNEEVVPMKKAPPTRRLPLRAQSMPVQKRNGPGTYGFAEDEASKATARALDLVNKLKSDLDSSLHVYEKTVDATSLDVDDYTADLGEMKTIARETFDYRNSRAEKKEKKVSSEKLRLELKKEQRMQRVRDRLDKEEKEKDRKRENEFLRHLSIRTGKSIDGPDMSEHARRERCYNEYKKMGMISKKEFIERLEFLAVDGLTAECIDLLPWNARGTMVNVGKLTILLQKGRNGTLGEEN